MREMRRSAHPAGASADDERVEIEIAIIHAMDSLCWASARVNLTEHRRSHVVPTALSEVQPQTTGFKPTCFGASAELGSLGKRLAEL